MKNANEIREIAQAKAEQIRQKNLREELIKIEELIENAAQSGMFSMTKRFISKENQLVLKELGYKIETDVTMNAGFSFPVPGLRVSWKEEDKV